MSLYLVFILCLTAIQCQEICHLIQTSGHFNGLQVYHSYPSDKLLMYKNGIQWQFDIKWDKRKPVYSLEVIPNTSQTIDSNIINMFGGFDSTSGTVKYESNDLQRIVTNCTDPIPIDTDSQYNLKSVIFKATYETDNLVIIYDKTGIKDKISCYDTSKVPKERLKDGYYCQRNIRPFPQFVFHLKTHLLESIDGVVDYKIGPDFGHILFFNINGRPKYCYQSSRDKELECNSNEALKPLFEQCFRGSGDQNGNTIEWVLGVSGVIVIIGLLVLRIYYLIKLNKNIDKTGNQLVTQLSSRRNTQTSVSQTATTIVANTSKPSDSSAKPTEMSVSTKLRDSSAVTSPPTKPSQPSKSGSSQHKPKPI